MKFKFINVLTLFILSSTLIFSNSGFAANTIDLSRWSDYAQSLRSCSPGVFQLPNALNITFFMINSFKRDLPDNKNRLYITNEIVGWQNNKCIVKQTSYTQDAAATKVVVHCAYAKIDLTSMANNAKDVSTQTSNESKDNSASIIVNKSCIIESRI